MKNQLTTGQKLLLAIFCFAVALLGFMVKLPSAFRHVDKELHAGFYFVAAAFLNFLFVGRIFWRHVIVFVLLFLFGAAIEYGQAYSNKFFRSRIHGRFDPEDLQWNVIGLTCFTVIWLIYLAATAPPVTATAKNNR